MPARALVLVLVVLLGVAATPAAAGQDVSSFESLPSSGVIGPGDEIRVISIDEETVEGRLVEVSEDGIVIEDGSARSDFRSEGVASIERRRPDTLWDGTLLGAGAGAAIGLVASLACRNSGACEGPVAGGLLVAVWAGAGAGFGALVDSRFRAYDTIYQAPGPLAGRAFRLRIRF